MKRLIRGLPSEESKKWLSRVSWSKQIYFVNLADEIKDGIQTLFYAYDDKKLMGCCAVRCEQHSDHRELCVTAMGGNFGSLKFMMGFKSCLEDLAKAYKCNILRGHVESCALKKVYEKNGFSVREILNGEWVIVKSVCLN